MRTSKGSGNIPPAMFSPPPLRSPVGADPAPVTVEVLAERDHAAWDAYVDAHPDAGCYHLRAWKVVAERAYGLRAPFLAARRRPEGPLAGALPLFFFGLPWARSATTGLFGAYGSVLADDAGTAEALVTHARALSARERARSLVVKGVGDLPGDAAQGALRADSSVFATLPLERDPERLWLGFRDKTRNAIRKAQRAGLELRVGAAWLPDFYDVLAENMHRKGTPIYGLPFLRELALALGDRAEVFTLWKDGTAVSGALAVRFRGVTCVPFASSRPSAFKHNPNNLLYWEMIRAACLRGDHLFDFGRSPRDSTTLAFKLGWGATVQPQPMHVFHLRGPMPVLASTPSVEKLAALWARLPRRLADLLGPAICGRFLI